MNATKIISGLMLFALILSSVGFATDTTTDAGTDIKAGVCQLYTTVNTVLGAVIFVLIVLAAVVYAAGQVMGAETRARASVWATSMIIGAVIGIIILVLVPPILDAMTDVTVTDACGPTTPPAGGGG
jgi:cytochrome bd-type quinol oxidase subunit 2